MGKDSNGKPDHFTKVNKRTEWTVEYAYNVYGFYMKNYWFKSVFSNCKKKKKTSPLIMTVNW